MNGLKTDTIINRDALYALRELPEESVHCCVTSPPYYALRDYGLDMQIGREDTPEQYIDRLTEVFRELRRCSRFRLQPKKSVRSQTDALPSPPYMTVNRNRRGIIFWTKHRSAAMGSTIPPAAAPRCTFMRPPAGICAV